MNYRICLKESKAFLPLHTNGKLICILCALCRNVFIDIIITLKTFKIIAT